MENVQQPSVEKRKTRFLLIIPVLILPFLAFLFWALGGGKAKEGNVVGSPRSGLNPHLPGAQLKTENLDKFKFYEKAGKDSARLRELAKRDPYSGIKDIVLSDSLHPNDNRFELSPSAPPSRTYKEDNETKVYRKLAELQSVIDKPTVNPEREKNGHIENRRITSSNHDESIDRLEKMMQVMKEDSGADEEIAQLNGLVNNFMDLQYPERMQEKLRTESSKNRGKVYPINISIQDNITVLTNKPATVGRNGFYSDEPETVNLQESMLPCLVNETQVVTDNSTVKFKVLRDFMLNGQSIPSGHELTGQVSFNGNRLLITVTSVLHNNLFIPVALGAFASDGLEGLPVKGNIAADVAKQSADQAIQGINVSTMGGSLGAEAVSAGIAATKSFIKRKSKPIPFTITAGYPFFLMDRQHK